MKIQGKVFKIMPKEEGQSAAGNFWEKQTLVINVTTGQKEIPVAISFFGERRTNWLKVLKEGQLVDVAVAIESREYDGRWFTEVQGFGIIPYVKAQAQEDKPATKGEQPPAQAQAIMPETNEFGF